MKFPLKVERNNAAKKLVRDTKRHLKWKMQRRGGLGKDLITHFKPLELSRK